MQKIIQTLFIDTCLEYLMPIQFTNFISLSKLKKMDKIRKMLENPLEVAVAATGIGLAAFYWFYARDLLFDIKKKSEKNKLDMSIHDLVSHKDDPNIIKIVITESIGNKSLFHSNLITKLKQFLLENNQHTLVNCSPLKLFNASAEVFVGTLSRVDQDDEREIMSYFENALKCELVIERTIIDIEEIKNKRNKTYFICDTNSMDLKAQSDQKLWINFLKEKQIDESALKNNYTIVFHVLNTNFQASPKLGGNKYRMDPIIKSDDEKIKQAWAGFKNYHELKFDHELEMQQNVDNALKQMIKQLQPYLPNTVNINGKY